MAILYGVNSVHLSRSELIKIQVTIAKGRKVIEEAALTMNKVTESFLSAKMTDPNCWTWGFPINFEIIIIFYCISNHENFIPKYLDNALKRFHLNLTNIEAAIIGKSYFEWFWKKFPVPKNTTARKIGNVVIPLLWQLRFHWIPPLS